MSVALTMVAVLRPVLTMLAPFSAAVVLGTHWLAMDEVAMVSMSVCLFMT